ncbi:hypothetical protein MNBD_GAMMA26-343 [hydrothermal vent metagenome]|uniref:Uncharacterized protein n=1 Tax=hydrothermal vent metagenome TaxID=652676 RepID=A0A3B1BT89_9ZZZZ
MTPFIGNHTDEHAAGIPFSFTDYDVYGHASAVIAGSKEAAMALMDWTGRAIRDGKRGAIPAHLASILVRLGIEEKQ